MLKITIIQDSGGNFLTGHVDSLSRSESLFKNQKVIASFDVSDLYLHASQL